MNVEKSTALFYLLPSNDVLTAFFLISRHYPLLAANGFRIENRLAIGLGTNALGMYAAWLLVATHVNLAQVLSYRTGLGQTIGSAITLAILMFFLALWFVLELGVFEKYLRFVYTPGIVFTVALSGIIDQNFDGNNPTMIFVAALLFVVIAMFLLKITLALMYERSRPAFPKVGMYSKPKPVFMYAQ